MIYFYHGNESIRAVNSDVVPPVGAVIGAKGCRWVVKSYKYDYTYDASTGKCNATIHVFVSSAEKKTRQKKESAYSAEFEAFWRLYPKRAGGNPKGKAYSAYSARIKAGIGHEIIELGVKRYAEYLKATNAIGSQYVMQAATFFGPDEHYLNDWAVPVNNAKPEWAKLPFRDEDLPGFAKKHGMPAAIPGESYQAYRARLRSFIEKKLEGQ